MLFTTVATLIPYIKVIEQVNTPTLPLIIILGLKCLNCSRRNVIILVIIELKEWFKQKSSEKSSLRKCTNSEDKYCHICGNLKISKHTDFVESAFTGLDYRTQMVDSPNK